MSKGALRFTAVVLCGLIVLVLFAGLDDLPRPVRAEIASERQALAEGRKQFSGASQRVQQALAAEPDLFRARSMNTALPQRLNQASAKLDSAAKDLAALSELEKKNRREDREQAEQILARERSLRAAALADAAAVRAETDRWLELKRSLPATLAAMQRDYQAIQSADLTPLAGTVQRAATDWPAKKGDLEGRLAVLRGSVASADSLWQSTAEPRRLAADGRLPGPELPVLLDAADTLHTNVAALPGKTAELGALAGQLYVSWDKILEDLDPDGGNCRQKVKIVRTRLVDVSGSKSEIASQDQWVTQPRRVCDVQRENIGMAIEHKSAGQFDYEAQTVAQPAGFAYIASPEQGSNQYGRWEHHAGGGNFWVWYGQYALMRDLFFRRDYRPLDTREYNDYRQMRSRGRTYYGRDERLGAPKYGTGGTLTARRYSDSRYARGGGYGSSRYSNRPGVFGPRRPSSSHTFGRSFSRSAGRAVFGGGRRFGRR